MPVTEAESLAAVPKEGWLRRYVIHGIKQTTAPVVYHIGTGLSVLSPTCPIAYGSNYAGPLHANMYTMLVGRSGEDSKSTALRVGRDLLAQAAKDLVGDFPGSPEGLFESLSRIPSQVIAISELGKFLASAQRGYFEPTKALLADLYDCHSMQRSKVNQKIIRIDTPRLSMVAACSIPYLEKHTLAEDWTGGFMGRWLVLYGKQERIDPDPVGDTTDEQWLVDELLARASLSSAGTCLGLDPVCVKLWKDWFTDLHNRPMPYIVAGVRARAPALARKVCLLHSWDFGPATTGQPWQIDESMLLPAIALVELHLKSLADLSDVIAEHGDARLRRSVLMAIEGKGGSCSLGELLGVLKMRKRSVVEMIDTLIEEGRIERIPTEQGYSYSLTF